MMTLKSHIRLMGIITMFVFKISKDEINLLETSIIWFKINSNLNDKTIKQVESILLKLQELKDEIN